MQGICLGVVLFGMHCFFYQVVLPYTNNRKFFVALMLVGIWFTLLSVCPFQNLEGRFREQLETRWVKNPLADFLILLTLALMAGYLLYHINIVRQDAQIIIDAFLYRVDVYYKGSAAHFFVDLYSTNGSRLLFAGEVLLALFMAKAFSQKNGMFLGTLPVAVLVFGGLLVGQVPSMKSMILMVGGILGMQLFTEGVGLGGRKGFVQKTAGNHPEPLRIVAVLILLTIIFAVSTSLSISTKASYQKWEEAVLRKQHAMERQVVDFSVNAIQRLLTLLGIDQPGIMTNSAPHYTGKTVMTVTADQPPQTDLYFRGFVGTKYENGRWSNSMEPDQALLLCWEQRRWLAERDYEYLTEVKQQGGQTKTFFSIQYAKDNRDAFGYLPYYSHLDVGYWTYLTRDYDWGVRKDPGLTQYKFAMPWLSPNVERDLLQSAHLLHQSSEWPEESNNEILRVYWNYILEQDIWLPEKGLEQTKELAQTLLKRGEVTLSDEEEVETVEFDGNGAVVSGDEDSYMRIPSRENGDEDVPLTVVAMDYTSGKISAGKVIRQLRAFLNATTAYSQHLNSKPPREDYVENFLFRQKRGYCEHYATAGAVLLRAMGIPARYVSGYKVSPSDFVENGDGTYTAQVPDSAAHAWTEVYTQETGWTVADMTPSDQSGQGSPSRDAGSLLAVTEEPEEDEFSPEEIGEGAETEKPEKTPETVETDTPEPQETPEDLADVPGNGSGGDDSAGQGSSSGMHSRKSLSDFLLIAGVSLLCLSLLFFLWKLQMAVRVKRLRRCREGRARLLEMNRLMEKYLRCCGYRGLPRMTDADYLKFLKRRYPRGKQKLEEYYRILEQARFARDGGGQEQIAFCEGVLSELGSYVIGQCSGSRRWYVRWLRNWRGSKHREAGDLGSLV